MWYIHSLEVAYDNSTKALDGEDINKGFDTNTSVYLKPIYTKNRAAAAVAFSVFTTTMYDTNGHDLGKGDGTELHRYLQVHYRLDGSMRPISDVYLREEPMGDGNTGDLNKQRGGRYLYLCWKFADVERTYERED